MVEVSLYRSDLCEKSFQNHRYDTITMLLSGVDVLETLTNVYVHNIFNLVYRVLQEKLREDAGDIIGWYGLLVKCFRKEVKFYEEQAEAGKLSDVYWYPSLYHSGLLELIHDRLGVDKFIELAKIFFLEFPKEIELRESDKLISILASLSEKENDVKNIIKRLKERNPSKYWDFWEKEKR